MVVLAPAGLPPAWRGVATVVPVNRTRQVAGRRVHTRHYYGMSCAATATESQTASRA